MAAALLLLAVARRLPRPVTAPEPGPAQATATRPAVAATTPAANDERALKVDVLVVGSDPEGLAAAVSSARNGLTTLLVDERQRLGGLWTCGGLNVIDLNYGSRGRLLNGGLFLEFYQHIHQANGDGSWSPAIDVAATEAYFGELTAHQPRLRVELGAEDLAVDVDGRQVVGLTCRWQGHRQRIRAACCIDATQDATIAAQAGAAYYVGRSDFHVPDEWQAMTQVFEVAGVDWSAIYHALRRHRGRGGPDRFAAAGFYPLMKGYQSVSGHAAARGLNLGRLSDDHVLINGLLIYGYSPLDPGQRELARADAIRELPSLVEHLRAHVPGFGAAWLVGPCAELYVRESRHVVTEYRLTLDDVLANRDYTDAIAYGSYEVDIQRTSASYPGVVLGKPQGYGIPLRCLVPVGVEHLLVVGRSAGFDSLAHGSARVVPVGIACGQAAGVAAAVALERGLPLRELADSPTVESVRRRLRQQGVRLSGSGGPDALGGGPAHAALAEIRALGLLPGGYDNNYRLGRETTPREFAALLQQAERRAGLAVLPAGAAGLCPGPTPADTLAWLAARLGLPASADPVGAAAAAGLLGALASQRARRARGLTTELSALLVVDELAYRRRHGATVVPPATQVDRRRSAS